MINILKNIASTYNTHYAKVWSIFMVIVSFVFCAIIKFEMTYFAYVPLLTFLAFVLFVIWADQTRKERAGNVFHPVVFFFISFVIVYFQNPLLFFYECKVPMDMRFAQFAPYGCTIALLALSSFFLGYFLFFKQYIPYRRKREPFSMIMGISHKDMKPISLFLAIMGLCCAVYHYWYYFDYYYAGVRLVFIPIPGRETPTLFSSGYILTRVMMYLLIASIISQWIYVLSFTPRSWKQVFIIFDKKVLFIFLICLMPQSLLGMRMQLLFCSTFLLAPTFLFVNALRWKTFVCILVLGMLYLSFSGTTRKNFLEVEHQTTSGQSQSMIDQQTITKPTTIQQTITKPTTVQSTTNQSITNQSIVQKKQYPINLPESCFNKSTSATTSLHVGRKLPTSALAASNNTNNIIVALKNYHVTSPNHYIGRYFLQEIFTCFPGAGLIINKLSYRDRYIGNEITYHFFYPTIPTSSISSNSIATIYYEFGLIGVLIIFLLFGFIVRKTEEKCFNSKNQIAFIFWVYFVHMLFVTNRMYIVTGLTDIIKLNFVTIILMCVCHRILCLFRHNNILANFFKL
jgi:hypothetical protein